MRLNYVLKTRAMVLLGVMACLICLFVTSEATAAPCTREDAQIAESGSSTLKTWEEVFRSYKHYQSCDDGAISEGYSSSIASLLASGWNQIGDLLNLLNTNPSFEKFVLRHIDDAMTRDQDALIRNNVSKRCPQHGTQFCAAVSRRFSELDAK